MKFLVVGGAGYIGSHMVKHLLAVGHEVVVADRVWPGPGIQWAKLDIADEAALDVLFGVCRFDAVFHFASSGTSITVRAYLMAARLGLYTVNWPVIEHRPKKIPLWNLWSSIVGSLALSL